MFIKSGSFHNANRVFLELPQPDRFTQNSMIMVHAQYGYGTEAIKRFHQIKKAHLLPDGTEAIKIYHSRSPYFV